MDIPLDEYNNASMNKSMLKVTTRFFQGVGQQDLIFAEYRDQETDKLISGVYVYDNIMYFFSSKNERNEYACLCSLDVHDLGELANMVVGNRLGGENTFEPAKLLAYIFNGVSLDQTSIKFSIKPNFYTDVWYNFNDLKDYINSLTVEEIMDVEGIENFYNYVRTNEVIMTFKTDVPIMNIVKDTDADFQEVVTMLGRVSDETRLTPTGADPVLEENE